MDQEKLTKLLKEIKSEQYVSPFANDDTIENLINEGIHDINNIAGKKIDYDQDLHARVLLKNYVMYRRYNRLSEFKEVYSGDYSEIQIRYYTTDL